MQAFCGFAFLFHFQHGLILEGGVHPPPPEIALHPPLPYNFSMSRSTSVAQSSDQVPFTSEIVGSILATAAAWQLAAWQLAQQVSLVCG